MSGNQLSSPGTDDPEDIQKCVGEGCDNAAYPHDWRKMCLECNPFGSSDVMNNDPDYQAWLFSNWD